LSTVVLGIPPCPHTGTGSDAGDLSEEETEAGAWRGPQMCPVIARSLQAIN